MPTKVKPTDHPPIFVHGVTDYPKMIQALEATVEAEQYKTKTMANNVVKINVNAAETYRKVVRFMRLKYYPPHLSTQRRQAIEGGHPQSTPYTTNSTD